MRFEAMIVAFLSLLLHWQQHKAVAGAALFRVHRSHSADAQQVTTSRSVRDGVYSAEQSSRGEPAYRAECGRCHGDNLAGTESGPPLAGETFMAAWNGRSLAELFETISVTMPQDNPAGLATPRYADILAFVLSRSGFPAADKELAAEAKALKQIRIEPAAK